MATVGYGDKAPLSFAGRLLGLVWMFTAIILVATFTAGITASLTVGALQGRVQGAEDLPRVRVATVNASTGAAWLQGRGIDAAGFDRPEQALQALATGKLDAVVYDAPILQYLIRREHADSLSVLPGQLDRQNYALVLRPGQGTQREQLNRSLLRALDRPAWRRQLDEYLGREN